MTITGVDLSTPAGYTLIGAGALARTGLAVLAVAGTRLAPAIGMREDAPWWSSPAGGRANGLLATYLGGLVGVGAAVHLAVTGVLHGSAALAWMLACLATAGLARAHRAAGVAGRCCGSWRGTRSGSPSRRRPVRRTGRRPRRPGPDGGARGSRPGPLATRCAAAGRLRGPRRAVRAGRPARHPRSAPQPLARRLGAHPPHGPQRPRGLGDARRAARLGAARAGLGAAQPAGLPRGAAGGRGAHPRGDRQRPRRPHPARGARRDGPRAAGRRRRARGAHRRPVRTGPAPPGWARGRAAVPVAQVARQHRGHVPPRQGRERRRAARQRAGAPRGDRAPGALPHARRALAGAGHRVPAVRRGAGRDRARRSRAGRAARAGRPRSTGRGPTTRWPTSRGSAGTARPPART